MHAAQPEPVLPVCSHPKSNSFTTPRSFAVRVDDTDGSITSYLLADVAVECEGDDYDSLQWLAGQFVLVWPVAVPSFFLILLALSRRSPNGEHGDLWRATHFLHSEYRDSFFYWEVAELLRRLALVGFVLLIPPQRTLLRLMVATIITLAHTVLLQYARPYHSESTACTAVLLSVALQTVLLVVLLVKVHAQLSEGEVATLFGFDNAIYLTTIILACNLLVLIGVVVLALSRMIIQKRNEGAQRLRYCSSGTTVRAPPLRGGAQYHLFLSHNWGSGQDQMRIIKQRLLEMMPDLRIFLDVDEADLDISKLEEYIGCRMASDGHLTRSSGGSLAVLIHCTTSYFKSPNCKRELRSAAVSDTQIITLLEVDKARGALDPPQIKKAVGELPWPEAELQQALDKLFVEGKEPIEWTRLGSMQTLTLRLIAERLLPPGVGATYVQHDPLPRVESIQPVRGRHHLCYSSHNEGVDRLLRELADAGCDVQHTSNLEGLSRCACFLVYLNTQTWQSGPAREHLEADVARAMDARPSVPLVLVHEAMSFGLPANRHCCDFSHFFEDDVTPGALIARGIYDKTAVSMRAGAFSFSCG